MKTLRAQGSLQAQHPQENPSKSLHSIFHGPKIFSNKILILALTDSHWHLNVCGSLRLYQILSLLLGCVSTSTEKHKSSLKSTKRLYSSHI